MNIENIQTILTSHLLWLSSNPSGERANLRGANLCRARLRGANLSGAELSGADLRDSNLSDSNLSDADLSGTFLFGADLSGADMHSADLSSADLRSADLSCANLRGANLSSADLRSADLRSADLLSADLLSADLRGADLRHAELRHADLSGAHLPHFQVVPETGSFEAWKKTSNGLVKLRIPASARRTSSLVGRKCRASSAKVVAVYPDTDGPQLSHYDGRTEYWLGRTLYADRWDGDIRIECTNGIHFFLTRAEAEEY